MVKSGSKVIGYVRVSTREQGNSGLGLDAQLAAIVAECQRKGWLLERVYLDVQSGRDADRRELQQALSALASGLVSALVVAKLDRLSRSVYDFAGILRTATEQGWALIALDLGVDTGTPSGKLVANVMISVAEWERSAISARTREGLSVKRGWHGVPDDVRARIARERAAGASLRAIAHGLNTDGVPTGHGGRQWYASTVKALLEQS
jgi:DNA invertase Pin-like site-specific DNA recombinase